MATTQKVLVYHKLESFRGAGDKVKSLLKEILPDNIAIENYSSAHEQYRHTGCTTAVVVIDARQTRTLLTPDRRDPNVDHWAELDMLSEITKPAGSILVAVYGDEGSKQLEDNRLIAKSWLTIWNFNDRLAYDLAHKGRCFSIWDKFNTSQTFRIREYINMVPLVPIARSDGNFLQLGSQDATIDDSVSRYPFTRTDIERRQVNGMDVQEYTYLDFKHKSGKSTKPKIKRHVVARFPPIQVCETQDPLKSMKRQLSTEMFKLHGLSNKGDNCFGQSQDSMDRVLVSCHCEKCFTAVSKYKPEITAIVKGELDTLGLTLLGDVIPYLRIHGGHDYEAVRGEMRNVISDIRGTDYLDKSESKLVEDRSVLFYFWFALFMVSKKKDVLRWLEWIYSTYSLIRANIVTVKIILFVTAAIVVYVWFMRPPVQPPVKEPPIPDDIAKPTFESVKSPGGVNIPHKPNIPDDKQFPNSPKERPDRSKG
ncbi:uncharacterized protein LOC144444744 [Glandiceps talaboti]